jgi:hypothetical protein
VKITAKIRVHRKLRTVTLGNAKYKIRAGKRSTVKVRITSKYRSQLKNRKVKHIILHIDGKKLSAKLPPKKH